jgi:hypothetical protein
MAEDAVSHALIVKGIIDASNIKFYLGKFYEYKKDGPKVGYFIVDELQLRVDIQIAYKKYKELNKGIITKDCTTGFVNECMNYLKREVYISESTINLNYMYVNNGILDVQNYKLIDTTPDIFCAIRLPVTFDDSAKCPNILKFFGDITMDDGSVIRKDIKGKALDRVVHDENDPLTLEEMCGYVLDSTNFVKKGIILLGHRHSGKTTYFNLLTELVGAENTSTLDLYQFGDKFSIPGTVDKLVNIGDDFGKDKLDGKTRGLLKKSLGNPAQMSTRRAHSSVLIDYIPRTKIYFAGNDLPSIKMYDDAFIDRWHILTFLNEYPINTEFFKTLTTPEEMSGLLNVALVALARIRKNLAFSKVKTQNVDHLYKMFEAAHKRDSRILSSNILLNLCMNCKKSPCVCVRDKDGNIVKVTIPIVSNEKVAVAAWKKVVEKVKENKKSKTDNWFEARKKIYTQKIETDMHQFR